MRKMFPGTDKSEEIRGTNKADVIRGEDGDDKLVGRGGDDTINGGEGKDKIFGGVGHDTLIGGENGDRFLFKETGDSNSDVISDFKHGSDRIGLDIFVFDELGLGTISISNFVEGASAQDADDFLIWDAAARKLYYDADGNGAEAQFLLAEIHLRGEEKVLTFDDITVFQPQSGG